MPKYIRPVNGRVSDSFDAHRNRTPPSVNPGTDYEVPIGTPVLAPAGGRIGAVDNDPAGGGGRMIGLDTYDGDGFDFLHLDRILVTEGQYVNQGDTIALSGNTGNSTGPHLHLSFRRRQGSHFYNAGNEDFEAAFLTQAALDVTPIEVDNEEEDNMLYYRDRDTNIIYARDLAVSVGEPAFTIIGKNGQNSSIAYTGAPIGAKIADITGAQMQSLIDWYGVKPVPAGFRAVLAKNKPAVKGL